MNKILVILIYFILFILFGRLSSIEIQGLKDSTQSGKFFVFTYMVIGASMLYLTRLMLSKTAIISINIIDVLISILFTYILINRYLLQADYNFSILFYSLLGLLAVYIILRSVKPIVYLYLLIGVILGGLVQAVYGNLQLHGVFQSNHNLFSITGSFFNPGPYSGYLSSVFPAAVGIYLFRNVFISEAKFNLFQRRSYNYTVVKFLISIIPLVTILAILLVIGITESRATWLSIIISSSFLLFNYYDVYHLFRKYFNSNLKKGIGLIFTIILVTGLLAALYSYKKDSANGRLLIWKVTLNMFTTKPLLGHGFDRFSSVYMDYQANYFKSNLNTKEGNIADNVSYAFNEPLQFLSENGLAGSIVLLLIFILLFLIKTPRTEPLKLISKAGLLGILIFSLFSYPSQILPIKLNAVVYLTFLAVSYKPMITYVCQNTNTTISRVIKTGSIIIICSISFYILQYINKLYKAFDNWDTAYSIYQAGDYQSAIKNYEKGYSVLLKDGSFLMQYGKALSMAGENTNAIRVLNKAKKYSNNTIIQIALGDSYKAIKQYSKAEKAYIDAWYMSPGRFYPKYLLTRLYNETGQKSKAIVTAKELLAKNIKVESVAIHEMIVEMKSIINQKK